MERDEVAGCRCVTLLILVQEDEIRAFLSLVLLVSLCSGETWTLTGSIRRRINTFTTTSLSGSLGNRGWTMSTELMHSRLICDKSLTVRDNTIV